MAGIDKLFNHGEDRRAFMKFRKYSIKSDDDCSVMHLVRFEAIITGAVDSVGPILDELDSCLTPCAPADQGGPFFRAYNSKRRCETIEGGRTVAKPVLGAGGELIAALISIHCGRSA